MLSERSIQKEQLDDLALGGEDLKQTLDGLAVINKFFGNTNSTLQTVKAAISQARQPLKIIDLGCGGGDNLRAIAKWCLDKGLAVELIGLDGNENILEYARAKNERYQIQYHCEDILDAAFEIQSCDVLISSHFVYHFSDPAFASFLSKCKSQVRHKIIFSELERSSIAYTLFKLGAPLLRFPALVKQDGLLAIKRAFRKKELIDIFRVAGIGNYRIERKWAFRFLVDIDLRPII